jgi:23S rRNA (cytidine1920-2'-O)/16S rRNA (cytidine1409-2'-O)-methyltransferase
MSIAGRETSALGRSGGERRSKARLDALLVERGLAESREKAQALVLAGEVDVGGRLAAKPGQLVASDAELAVRARPPYVGRGGLKLERALDTFSLDVRGLVVVDVGASTGGFTDCLLQRGAARVYAIDVGQNQLDWRLRSDPRVVVMERTNVRFLSGLPETPGALVADVSFISLKLALPPVVRLLPPSGWVVALVKPQFEAGRELVGKGGVVRDPAVHRLVLGDVLAWAVEVGLSVRGAIPSPIRGPAGNVEFLAYFARQAPGRPIAEVVEECLEAVER